MKKEDYPWIFFALLICLFAIVFLKHVIINGRNVVPRGPEGAFARGADPDRDYLIIVNKDNKFDFDGEYSEDLEPDLIYVSDINGDTVQIEKGANTAFTLLQQRLLSQDNIRIGICDGWRSEEDQEWIYNQKKDNKKPGFSEYHTGLLVSFAVWYKDNDGYADWSTEENKRGVNDATLEKIYANLADFGFVVRYPEDKAKITGVSGKPYEIRFVGSSMIAHDMQANDLCLEEYLNK